MSSIVPHYSPARAAGDWVFVSGQLPFGPDRTVIAGGIREQTAQCLANIAAILAGEGLGLEHVVKTTVWLSRTADFTEFNAAYAAVFVGRPPARSTVRADLMVDARVEIEAVAFRGAKA